MSTPAQFADALYRLGTAPWDIGEAQPVIRSLIANGGIQGRVLDAGCGAGHHSIELARAGCDVVGIDASPVAIRRARLNARAAGVDVEFRCGDAADELANALALFDAVVDSKLFDNLPDTATRRRYAAALHRAMKPGGELVLYNFSRGTSDDGYHTHGVTPGDFDDWKAILPAAGFIITSATPASYLLRNHGWRPMCPRCPQRLPDVFHAPITEILAINQEEMK